MLPIRSIKCLSSWRLPSLCPMARVDERETVALVLLQHCGSVEGEGVPDFKMKLFLCILRNQGFINESRS